MSEAWRGVVEFQVLINGIWEDRRYETKPYETGSNGPMTKVNEFIRRLESGKYFEGSFHRNNLQTFNKNEYVILSRYKEESSTWKQV